jgi:ribonuclease D
MPAPSATPQVVAREDDLRAAASEAAAAPRVAIDVEASGMFAYRARVCLMQLAWDEARRVVVVDAMATPVAALSRLLGDAGPVKIVHDVAFDARLLAEQGVALGNVHDTSLAARMLGRTATGLASMLESELGVHIAKEMQHHDWRLRPIDDAMMAYLAADVFHLERLEKALWHEVTERGIEEAVLEETRYRIDTALAAARTPVSTPPYARIKGVDRLAERELAVLRVVAEVREQEAERRDVPPYKVASNEALLAIARARPSGAAEVARMRGISSAPSARGFVSDLARAVASAGERLPDEERARFERPRTPAAVAKARREREARLLAWRRAEAKRRGVDEQVVMPGHCVKDAVEADATTVSTLARVPGIGAFRVARDGEAIAAALRGDAEGPP